MKIFTTGRKSYYPPKHADSTLGVTAHWSVVVLDLADHLEFAHKKQYYVLPQAC